MQPHGAGNLKKKPYSGLLLVKLDPCDYFKLNHVKKSLSPLTGGEYQYVVENKAFLSMCSTTMEI